MALELIKNAVFRLSGREGKLRGEMYRRQHHVDEVAAYSTIASSHHSADERIIAADTARIEEIRSELARHRR